MRDRLAHWWSAFADAVGAFIEEALFRVSVAIRVLLGKSPRPVEKRWWNRAIETPILPDVFDWTDERHIFSILIWPALELEPENAAYAQLQRANLIKEVIAKGASEMMWSTRFETDYGLRWDPDRRVWIATDGFAYASPKWRDQDGVA